MALIVDFVYYKENYMFAILLFNATKLFQILTYLKESKEYAHINLTRLQMFLATHNCVCTCMILF